MSSTNVPSGVVRAEYWIWPMARREASLLVIHWTRSSAALPATSICPMWLTSKIPAFVRTARCSSVMPEYSTGMSQPPNSTIRAPIDRCRACSGVFLSALGGVDIVRVDPGPRSGGAARETPYNVLSRFGGVKKSGRRREAPAGRHIPLASLPPGPHQRHEGETHQQDGRHQAETQARVRRGRGCRDENQRHDAGRQKGAHEDLDHDDDERTHGGSSR